MKKKPESLISKKIPSRCLNHKRIGLHKMCAKDTGELQYGIVWFCRKSNTGWQIPGSQVSDLCNPILSVQHAAGLGAAVPWCGQHFQSCAQVQSYHVTTYGTGTYLVPLPLFHVHRSVLGIRDILTFSILYIKKLCSCPPWWEKCKNVHNCAKAKNCHRSVFKKYK